MQELLIWLRNFLFFRFIYKYTAWVCNKVLYKFYKEYLCDGVSHGVNEHILITK